MTADPADKAPIVPRSEPLTIDVSAVAVALDQAGDWVTLRRMTGRTAASRSRFDVACRASVQVGAASVLAQGVQQNADRVMLTSLELDAAQWPGPPKHGDLVIYADGRVTAVQGSADVRQLTGGSVYILRCLGA
jgi:hypothetical protein